MAQVVVPDNRSSKVAHLATGSAVAWVVIIGLAAGFRLWGLTWGWPRFDLNPDEFLILRIASKLTWQDPNPHFFSYSGFVFHQSFLTAEALKLFDIQLPEFSRLLMHRLWSVFWGLLTVVVMFPLARQLGATRRAAFVSAGLMAILPLHVWETHYGTTDSPLLFWMCGSLLVTLTAYDQPTLRRAALAGLLAGFAIGTKYPGAFVGVPFVVAIVLATSETRLPNWWAAIARLAMFGGATIAGSFLVSPFIYLQAFETAKTADPRAGSSIGAFLFELGAMQGGEFGFDLHAPGWQFHPYVYELFAGWPFSLGIALYLLVLAGTVAFVRRLDRKRIIVLTFIAAYLGVVGSWQFVPLRYSLPVLPLFLVMAGLFLDDLIIRRRLIGATVGALVAVYTVAFTATTTRRFAADTRLEASTWGDESLNPGSVVLLLHTRSRSYLPRLDTTKFYSRIVRVNFVEGSARDYQQRLKENGPRAATVYVCMSSLDYLRYYRSGVPESITAWDQVRANPSLYRPIKSFEATYLNQSFYQRLDPMFATYFVSPTIEFYEFIP